MLYQTNLKHIYKTYPASSEIKLFNNIYFFYKYYFKNNILNYEHIDAKSQLISIF